MIDVQNNDDEADVDNINPDFIFENEPSSSEDEEDDNLPKNSHTERPDFKEDKVYRFKCTKCPKGFSSESQIRVHFGYWHQPMRCDVCGITLNGRQSYQVHRYRNHSEVKGGFPCSTCREAFATANLLSRHKDKFHGNHKFKCSHCPASFKLSNSEGTRVVNPQQSTQSSLYSLWKKV